MKSKLKIAGLMVFVLVFALTMTACDTAMDTGSDVTEEVEETGELLVEADLPELSQLESEVETSDVSAQSTVEERFSDYEIIVRLEHDDSGRSDEESDSDDDNVSNLDTEFSFGNVLAGEWTMTVELKADYKDDDNDSKKTIASTEENVTVEPGISNSADVDVGMNDGGLDITVEIPADAESGEMILKKDNEEIKKISADTRDNFDLNGNNQVEVNWTNLAPARAYTLELRFRDDEGDLITKAKPIVHVLPGTVKSLTAEYFAGRNAFEFDLNLPPSVPTGVEMTDEGLTWEDDNDKSYIIARRELDENGRDYFQNIAEGDDATSPFVDEDQIPGLNYEYVVIAVDGNLTSDYSKPVSTKETVSNEDKLNAALDNSMISTIIVAEHENPYEGTFDVERSGVTIIAAKGENPSFEPGVFRIGGNPSEPQRADDITISGLTFIDDSKDEQAIQGVVGDGITVKKCIFKGYKNHLTFDYAGPDPKDITIEGNEFKDVNSDEGTSIGSTEDVQGLEILNNTFENNRNSIGIGAGATDVNIQDNTFRDGDFYLTNRTVLDLVNDVMENNDFVNAVSVDDVSSDFFDGTINEWIAIDINTAISSAAEDAMLKVAEGTYDEGGEQLVINVPGLTLKSLKGAEETIIEPTMRLESSLGDKPVLIEGFTIGTEPTNKKGQVYYAVIARGDYDEWVKVRKNIIETDHDESMGAVYAEGDLIKLDFNNNKVKGPGFGINVAYKGSHDWSNPKVTVSNNDFNDVSTGVIVGGGGEFKATYNNFENSGTAFLIGQLVEESDLDEISSNNFDVNDNGVNNMSEVTFDATNNWWGTTEGIDELIEGNVTWDPNEESEVTDAGADW